MILLFQFYTLDNILKISVENGKNITQDFPLLLLKQS